MLRIRSLIHSCLKRVVVVVVALGLIYTPLPLFPQCIIFLLVLLAQNLISQMLTCFCLLLQVSAKFLNDISQLDNADMASINSSMAMELNQFSQSEFVNVGAKLTAEISQVNIDISGEMIAGMFLLDSNKATSFSAEVANNLNQDLSEQMLLNISNHVTRSDFINEFSTNISLLDDREFNEISKFNSNDLLMMAESEPYQRFFFFDALGFDGILFGSVLRFFSTSDVNFSSANSLLRF